jgi:hypothetical protein
MTHKIVYKPLRATAFSVQIFTPKTYQDKVNVEQVSY